MQTECVVAAVEESLPGAMVKAEIHADGGQGQLTLQIIGSGHAKQQTHRIAYGALVRAGLANNFSSMVIQVETRDEWLLAELSRIIQSALGPVSQRYNRSVQFDIRKIRNDTLEIRTCQTFYHQSYASIESLLSKLRDVSGVEKINIQVFYDSGSANLPLTPFAQDDEDFDDAAVNPNWPSTTGNRSGGGRGNNPPSS